MKRIITILMMSGSISAAPQRQTPRVQPIRYSIHQHSAASSQKPAQPTAPIIKSSTTLVNHVPKTITLQKNKAGAQVGATALSAFGPMRDDVAAVYNSNYIGGQRQAGKGAGGGFGQVSNPITALGDAIKEQSTKAGNWVADRGKELGNAIKGHGHDQNYDPSQGNWADQAIAALPQMLGAHRGGRAHEHEHLSRPREGGGLLHMRERASKLAEGLQKGPNIEKRLEHVGAAPQIVDTGLNTGQGVKQIQANKAAQQQAQQLQAIYNTQANIGQ